MVSWINLLICSHFAFYMAASLFLPSDLSFVFIDREYIFNIPDNQLVDLKMYASWRGMRVSTRNFHLLQFHFYSEWPFLLWVQENSNDPQLIIHPLYTHAPERMNHLHNGYVLKFPFQISNLLLLKYCHIPVSFIAIHWVFVETWCTGGYTGVLLFP